MLADIGAERIPQILVYNKIDRLEMQPRIDRDPDGHATAVWISAEKRIGLDLLAQGVAQQPDPLCPQGPNPYPGRARAPCARGSMPRRQFATSARRRTARLSSRWSCRMWSC